MDAQQQWLAAQGYVGREYVPGQYDCAHLAIDVQREVFGRHISLPAPHRLGRAGQVAQIRALRDELAGRAAEVQAAIDSLMRLDDLDRGRALIDSLDTAVRDVLVLIYFDLLDTHVRRGATLQ